MTALPRTEPPAASSTALPSFEELFPAIREPLAALEAELERLVDNRVKLIPDVGSHLLGSGGKRIRPALFFLSARVTGYEGPNLVALVTDGGVAAGDPLVIDGGATPSFVFDTAVAGEEHLVVAIAMAADASTSLAAGSAKIVGCMGP